MAYEVPFTTHGEPLPFLEHAQELVFSRVKKRLEDAAKPYQFMREDVRAYWFSNDAKGWEVRLSTTLPDSVYYRVYHDNATRETTLDVYLKFDSQKFKDDI